MSVSCLIRLAKGEKIIPGAKTIEIGDGQQHLPQHYATYHHTLDSITQILSAITFSDDVLLFADHDANGLYLQVGVIGQENYQQENVLYPHKIVYGRKWRIDSDTPTSEIVQTAMLAIQKSREHEVRELLTFHSDAHAKTSAPLSCHQDINLLQKAARIRPSASEAEKKRPLTEELHQTLETIRFLGRRLIVRSIQEFDKHRVLADIQLEKDKTSPNKIINHFEEFNTFKTSIVLESETISTLVYTLLDHLILHSNRFVEKQFAYQGFNRFNRQLHVSWIAKNSKKSRPYKKHLQDKTFKNTFERSNFNVDNLRTPKIGYGVLADINRKKISTYPELNGHMPKGYIELPKSKVI